MPRRLEQLDDSRPLVSVSGVRVSLTVITWTDTDAGDCSRWSVWDME